MSDKGEGKPLMSTLVWAAEAAPQWLRVAIVVGLVIAIMIRNQRQAYAYGVWDATRNPDSQGVRTVLNKVERWAWRDGEVAHLFSSDVHLVGTKSEQHNLL